MGVDERRDDEEWSTERSSSKPPDDEEEPENHDEEDDIPEPATALTGGHVVHAAKGAGQNAGGFGEGVVLDSPVYERDESEEGIGGGGEVGRCDVYGGVPFG